MAKQMGAVVVTGTLDDITFYKRGGEYYARRKSSLNKKRVMKDPAFARSRARMSDFGKASAWCRPIYQHLPAACKGQGIQQKMTGRAHALFMEGKSETAVKEILLREFGPATP